MTAPQSSSRRATAPAPVSLPTRRTPPPLRVVRATPRRRRARLMTVLVSFAVVVSLFGLVASHVVLTQGQFRLDRLKNRAEVEHARYQRLRLQVAELESPSRIVATAQERLGMVPPPSVTYLSPTGAVSAPVGKPEVSGDESAAEEGEYGRVKRSLAGSR